MLGFEDVGQREGASPLFSSSISPAFLGLLCKWDICDYETKFFTFEQEINGERSWQTHQLAFLTALSIQL